MQFYQNTEPMVCAYKAGLLTAQPIVRPSVADKGKRWKIHVREDHLSRDLVTQLGRKAKMA